MIRRELEHFFAALRFFTRLPVPAWVGHSSAGLNAAARWFPAVGALIGALAALAYVLAAQLWPPAIALLLSMAASIYLTGAFHEDGLSDTVDGLGGGWEKQRILEIMKDSRIGNYGAIALWLALSGKFALLTAQTPALLPVILIAGHSLSRACSVSLLAALDYVREDALTKAKPLATRLSPGALLFTLGCGLLPLALLPWQQALSGLTLAVLATFWLARKFRRWLGGYTGDCLGATQQVAEIAFYLGLLAQWPL
ncbi:MAG: adenosylcobinamide-GDP ribazoletransferase [Azonexus sp.]